MLQVVHAAAGDHSSRVLLLRVTEANWLRASPETAVNLPPKNRFNAGFNFNADRFFGNLSVSYTDEAFWQDVLDARIAGTTEAYTLVNTGLGVRWLGDKVTTSLKVTNLANEEVLQHIFGDITKRQVVGELRVTF